MFNINNLTDNNQETSLLIVVKIVLINLWQKFVSNLD